MIKKSAYTRTIKKNRFSVSSTFWEIFKYLNLLNKFIALSCKYYLIQVYIHNLAEIFKITTTTVFFMVLKRQNIIINLNMHTYSLLTKNFSNVVYINFKRKTEAYPCIIIIYL